MTYVYAVYRRDFEGEVYMPFVCADESAAIKAKKTLSGLWHSDSVWYVRVPLMTTEYF
jgi:hypothetical protein